MDKNSRAYTYLIIFTAQIHFGSIDEAEGSAFYYASKKLSECSLSDAKEITGKIVSSTKKAIRSRIGLPNDWPIRLNVTDIKLIE